jgi:hypothetical protein
VRSHTRVGWRDKNAPHWYFINSINGLLTPIQ